MIQSAQSLLWVFPKEDPNLIKNFVDEFNIHPVMAQVLVSRGYRKKQDVHQFLYVKLLYLHAPDLLNDMDKAVQRVYAAIKAKERILIVGDNDVDGMSGTALLVDFLRTFGVNVLFFIPSRTLGDAYLYAKEQGCSLIITVDCGIKAEQSVSIDLIITDHHEPTDKISNCVATLNPKRLNSTYPNRDLTGVGVAFKLAHALINYLVTIGDVQADLIDLKRYLDLVALGTISDMGGTDGRKPYPCKIWFAAFKKDASDRPS